MLEEEKENWDEARAMGAAAGPIALGYPGYGDMPASSSHSHHHHRPHH